MRFLAKLNSVLAAVLVAEDKRAVRVEQALIAAWQTTSLVPEPPVTPPLATAIVDALSIRIKLRGMSSSYATAWATFVLIPWPISQPLWDMMTDPSDWLTLRRTPAIKSYTSVDTSSTRVNVLEYD